ncbi:MAG: AIR synthase-related protein, partial [Candidatus Sumerlaeota bacterium]|nr:AIR synthase-related protein [Candidatus Sumerlaeota bacterium]
RLYPRPVLRVLAHYQRKRIVHGMAHITGGGIPGNVPRVIPPGLRAEISRKAWTVPPIFGWLQKTGNVPTQEMWRVFNMGIGFVLVVSPYYADHVAEMLETGGETVYRLGHIARGPGGIALK